MNHEEDERTTASSACQDQQLLFSISIMYNKNKTVSKMSVLIVLGFGGTEITIELKDQVSCRDISPTIKLRC